MNDPKTVRKAVKTKAGEREREREREREKRTNRANHLSAFI